MTDAVRRRVIRRDFRFMKITTIQVTAGRTFNHPHEQYSNLRPSVTMSATIDDGDDPHISIRDLQQRAEGLVEDHKKSLLNSIEELYQLTERQAEVRGLEQQLKCAQKRLEDIRAENPTLQLEG
jgi:hypothetical protein